MTNKELANHLHDRIKDINHEITIPQSNEGKCFLDGKRKAFQYVLDLLEEKEEMTPMELIKLLDKGMVEELKMYYNGQKTVVNIHNLPAVMPNYEISKLWNSEDGKGISVLLADNMEHYPIPKFVDEDKTYTDKGGVE